MSTYIISLAVFFSISPVIVVFAIRQAVKRQRQETIRDLEAVFNPTSHVDLVVPSFEFVKYKYFLPGSTSSGESRTPRADYSVWTWLISPIPLVTLLLILNLFVFSVVIQEAFGKSLTVQEVFSTPPPAWSTLPTPPWTWAIVAAYAGGYLFMTRTFFRAINNFDFSPISYVAAANHLLFGTLMGAMVYFGLLQILQQTAFFNNTPTALAATIIACFAAGYLPDAATRNIIRVSKLRDFKREDTGVYSAFKATPIEVIDGIDSEIRDRLSDYHIVSVQNLAAANPIMLFVETPYGVYQIMDWVAQAQLCSSVGTKALVKLWALGIRTLFDLERIALDPAYRNNALLRSVGLILLENAPRGASGSDFVFDEDAVVKNIMVRIESPHVHRLRQIFVRVGDRIGNAYRRFAPISVCPANESCPFRVPSNDYDLRAAAAE